VIHAKFWENSGVPDDSDDDADQEESSTPEFISDAMDAGFTLEQLSKAKRALNSGNTPCSDDVNLSKKIVSKLVQRNINGRPWQGPLPPPRVSPPRTLGDFLAMASY
jgi:hypothetical protein